MRLSRGSSPCQTVLVEDQRTAPVEDQHIGRRRRHATWMGWGLWLAFVLVMLAGADHPPPVGFWILPVVSLVIVAATRLVLPTLLERWASGHWVQALLGAALAGAGCAAVIWTALAAVTGNLLAVGLVETLTGFAIVMTVGALAWVVMVVVARLARW